MNLDPNLSWLGQLLARGWAWSTATRRRRLLAAPLFLHLVVYSAATAFPPAAHAATGAVQAPLMWALGVVDSYGVPLSQYTFTTDYGSVMDFGTRAMWGTLLQIEAGFFVAVGGFAIWLLTFALSFEFLRVLVLPVSLIAENYASRIIPGIAVIAAMVAGLFVAFNMMRGNAVRAASQAAVAVCVALIGAALFHSPISWVVSENGPLIAGRNVAIGLGSNTVASSQQAAAYPRQMQGVMATEFVRRPLQMWNLGAIADDTPSCAAAWSAGTASGNQDRIKDGIASCGAPNSAAMKSSADNPGPGQIATGLMLLCFIGVFAIFCLTLSLHIIGEFFRAIANAFRLLWDAAVGVIPGVAQSNLVNTFVAMMFSGVAMFAYVAFAVFIGQIVTTTFTFAGNGIIGMISALIVMVLALVGTRRVSQGLKRSSASTTSSILSGLGAPPVPERTSILQEKSKGFLRDVGQIGTGVAAGAVGAKAVAHFPALAPGLQTAGTYLPHRRKLRYVAKGAAQQQKAAAKAAKAAAQQQSTTAAAPAAAATHPAPGPTPSMAAAAAAHAAARPASAPPGSHPTPGSSAAATSPPSTPPAATSASSSSPPATAAASSAPVVPSVTSADGRSPASVGPGSSPPAGFAAPHTPNAPTSGNGMSPGSARPASAAPPPLPDFDNPAEAAASPPPSPQPAVTSGDDMSPTPAGPPDPVPPTPPQPPAPERRPNTPPPTAGTSTLPPTDPAAAPPAPYEEQP